MPAESERLRRRVRPRDRWFLGVVAATAVAAAPAAALLSRHETATGRDSSCVTTIRAGFMGGETHAYCGADAVAFCRAQAALPSPAADCRKQELLADPAQP
jgi:hypothetical protein